MEGNINEYTGKAPVYVLCMSIESKHILHCFHSNVDYSSPTSYFIRLIANRLFAIRG